MHYWMVLGRDLCADGFGCSFFFQGFPGDFRGFGFLLVIVL